MKKSNLNSTFFFYIVHFYDNPYSNSCWKDKNLIKVNKWPKICSRSLKFSFFSFYEKSWEFLKSSSRFTLVVLYSFFQKILDQFYNLYTIIFFLSFYWLFFLSKKFSHLNFNHVYYK